MDIKTQNELIKIVQKNYDEIADDYSETRKKALWPELFKLTAEVKNGDKILDVGCGSGKLLDALKDKKILYTGIDPCGKLLYHAKKRKTNGAIKKKEFITGSILNLGELKEINFDYVFCIAVLQHIPGKNLRLKALKQLKNKAKNRGRIIISVWDMWSDAWNEKGFKKKIYKFWLLKLFGKNNMDFGDILFDWKNSEGKIVSQRYYHAFRKRELKKLLKKAGLKIKKFYRDKYNYYLVLKNR